MRMRLNQAGHESSCSVPVDDPGIVRNRESHWGILTLNRGNTVPFDDHITPERTRTGTIEDIDISKESRSHVDHSRGEAVPDVIAVSPGPREKGTNAADTGPRDMACHRQRTVL